MLINEVVKITGLTKKTIYFYIDQGLITPKISKWNNYRDYETEDVYKLLIIAALRRFGLSVKEIKIILTEPKRVDIILHNRRNEIQKQILQLADNLAQLDFLLFNMSPNCKLQELSHLLGQIPNDDKNVHYKEHLLNLFPNQNGRKYALIIWEAFLDMPLDTDEKFKIWQKIINIIDNSLENGELNDYENIYSSLSDDEIAEDYRLRQLYVQEIAFMDNTKISLKAQEIIDFLCNLENEPRFLKHWIYDYNLLVKPVLILEDDKIGNLLGNISYSYFKFKDNWKLIRDEVYIFFKKKENQNSLNTINKLLEYAPIIINSHMGSGYLMYMDFLKNTLYKI